jgi:hypothetical protein
MRTLLNFLGALGRAKGERVRRGIIRTYGFGGNEKPERRRSGPLMSLRRFVVCEEIITKVVSPDYHSITIVRQG